MELKKKLFDIKQQRVINEVDRIHFCKKRMLALTFDASWGNVYTAAILDKLKRYHVQATFFISGIWIEKYPEDLREIFEDGHEIGNHSYKHLHMLDLSEKDIFHEIDKTEQLSREIIKVDSCLFRCPYGESDERLLQLLKKRGFVSIKWTIDSKDWKGISSEEIYSNIVKSGGIENGAIILMHNSGEHTVESLDLIIPALQKEGYELVKVSELLNTVPIYRHKLNKLKRKKILMRMRGR